MNGAAVPGRAEANAMSVSLAVGCLMLAAKVGAWLWTGSAAIFADAAESVVHVAAVAFAAFSVWLCGRPASRRSPYGYERVAFFSAGFEGLVILLVALAIIWTTVEKWRRGLELSNLGDGVAITLAAVLVNGALGLWLIRQGKRASSIILVADGKHVLTDSWTSLGAVAGLSLVMLTGWRPFDPLFAIATALNIMWTGTGLLVQAIAGLLDINDRSLDAQLRTLMDQLAAELGIGYHDLQARDTGRRILVHVHLLFPYAQPIGEAHRVATVLECRLAEALGRPAEVTTHLEALEDHTEVHSARVSG